jgi:hypothetical protein
VPYLKIIWTFLHNKDYWKGWGKKKKLPEAGKKK